MIDLSTYAAGLALAVTTAVGCSSSSTSKAIDAAPAGDAHRALDAARPLDAPRFLDAPAGSTLRLVIPVSYSGVPRELAVIGVKQVPVSGVPDSIFLTDMTPMATAGQTETLSLDTSAASAMLYVVVVLYQQGGGQFTPKSGVDYVAQSAAPFTFAGAPLDLGTLNLVLAP